VFGWANAQPNTDASFVPVDVTPQHEGPATVEAYTVMHDRDGKPETALAAVRTADGYRAWASTDDRSDATALTEGEWVGRTVTVADGSRLVP